MTNNQYSISRSPISSIAIVFFALVSFGFASKRSEKVSLIDSSSSTPRESAASSSVWIVRSDGAQYCMPGSGHSLVQGSAELQTAQIEVLESKKGTDGKMHAQVCGGSRGATNNYLIQRDKLSQALKLGYSEVHK
jgi:hypothetical protein